VALHKAFFHGWRVMNTYLAAARLTINVLAVVYGVLVV
jgi:hypothetical protein